MWLRERFDPLCCRCGLVKNGSEAGEEERKKREILQKLDQEEEKEKKTATESADAKAKKESFFRWYLRQYYNPDIPFTHQQNWHYWS